MEVARDLSHIGNVLCDLGKLDAAAAAFREAHGLDASLLGAAHVHTASDLAAIGQVLCTQRKWREALPMLQQAHHVLAGALDAQHPNLLAVGRFLRHCTERAQQH